jgi:ketosteroid isomerase-like protein
MRTTKPVSPLSARRVVVLAALLAMAFAGFAADCQELARQVRLTETAFARTMAERDWTAFQTHVADEAIFFSRTGVLRGKTAVSDGWKPFFSEAKAPFSWEPEQVEVLDSGTLALSSGPVLDPERKRIGTFQSIWRLEADGRWRIVFDKGCPRCD